MPGCISYVQLAPHMRPKLRERLQPYITKHYFGLQNPPVNLAKIAIGNGVLTNVYVFAFLPIVRVPLLLSFVSWG